MLGAARVLCYSHEFQLRAETIWMVSVSAGNNISNASSESVTSLAVPNTVTVLRKEGPKTGDNLERGGKTL